MASKTEKTPKAPKPKTAKPPTDPSAPKKDRKPRGPRSANAQAVRIALFEGGADAVRILFAAKGILRETFREAQDAFIASGRMAEADGIAALCLELLGKPLTSGTRGRAKVAIGQVRQYAVKVNSKSGARTVQVSVGTFGEASRVSVSFQNGQIVINPLNGVADASDAAFIPENHSSPLEPAPV